MNHEQVIRALIQAGVPVTQWEEVCAYAARHTLEFARAIAEAEREACADACTSAHPLSDSSARSVVSCCAAAILGRP